MTQASLADDGTNFLPPTTSNEPPLSCMCAFAGPESWQVPQVPAVAESHVSSNSNWFCTPLVAGSVSGPGAVLIGSASVRAA